MESRPRKWPAQRRAVSRRDRGVFVYPAMRLKRQGWGARRPTQQPWLSLRRDSRGGLVYQLKAEKKNFMMFLCKTSCCVILLHLKYLSSPIALGIFWGKKIDGTLVVPSDAGEEYSQSTPTSMPGEDTKF